MSANERGDVGADGADCGQSTGEAPPEKCSAGENDATEFSAGDASALLLISGDENAVRFRPLVLPRDKDMLSNIGE